MPEQVNVHPQSMNAMDREFDALLSRAAQYIQGITWDNRRGGSVSRQSEQGEIPFQFSAYAVKGQ